MDLGRANCGLGDNSTFEIPQSERYVRNRKHHLLEAGDVCFNSYWFLCRPESRVHAGLSGWTRGFWVVYSESLTPEWR